MSRISSIFYDRLNRNLSENSEYFTLSINLNSVPIHVCFFLAKIIECKLSGMIEKNERLLKC